MKQNDHSRFRTISEKSLVGVTILLLVALSLKLQAALPSPLVDLRFPEGSNTTSTNAGSLGGSLMLVQANNYPGFDLVQEVNR